MTVTQRSAHRHALRRHAEAPGRRRIALAFFLSGAAALAYQVAWQRLLFVVVGVDTESVTIVVSTFMLGLGLGAIVGGWLADAAPRFILLLFALLEAGIAVFGWFSADLLLALGQLFATLSRPAAAGLAFGALLFPTLCMGATLPMLVAEGFRRTRNIGVSTGTLYFINTLGAAVGACAVGLVALYWTDLRGAVHGAAVLNALASVVVLTVVLKLGRLGRRPPPVAVRPSGWSAPGHASSGWAPSRSPSSPPSSLPPTSPPAPRR